MIWMILGAFFQVKSCEIRIKSWVQKALRCIRGGEEGEFGEKDEVEDMEEKSSEETQASSIKRKSWAVG